MKALKALVGFEESQAVCIALREQGIEAYSNDLKDCSGGYPEWHIKNNFFEYVKKGIIGQVWFQNGDIKFIDFWDLIILHPPCTYTAICGNRWYWNSPLRREGIELCTKAWNESKKVCNHVALEQPKTIMQKYIGKKSQVIQPWMFGHGETKETWLWLHNLPLLKPTNIVEGREHRIWKMPPSPDRQELRSKTYKGVAEAIATQWSLVLTNQTVNV